MITFNESPDPGLRDLFLRALELTDEQARAEFLRQACGANEARRKELETLLAAHKEDSFMKSGAVKPAAGPSLEDSPTLVGAVSPERSNPNTMIGRNIRYFGDYEIFGEIARGGMGVVYKAKQKSLNRVVALKMIRAGKLANEGEVSRFRTEAEAAANLQHPNIVAIHEIGENEGQHYFSMDYVEGTDLAKLCANGPLPVARAAAYVKKIAEAIGYAHAKGTLHRDLKPHNVLIDGHDQPRITDFGLAKLTQQESTLTQDGTIMGSPSYMPPEQAAGKLSEVGAWSDVYSIGSVLYHLITGRAPFTGESAVATMRQVMEDEPVRPSALNPKVPEDLETICLKCLQKLPAQRYGSAEELAAELGRFLNFEPILARPASQMRRGWSWIQKHPWAVAGGFASIGLGLGCVAYGMFERARFGVHRLTGGEIFPPTIEASPSVQFFIIFAAIAVLLHLEGKYFRSHYQKGAAAGKKGSSTALWLHVAVGLAATVVGLSGLAAQIKAWAWSSEMNPMILLEGASVVCALALNWAGCSRFWEAMGMHETSQFRATVDKALENQIAVDWQSWPAWKLIGFPFWMLVAIWSVSILVIGGIFFARSIIGLITTVVALGLTATLIQGGMRVIKERHRLLTRLFLPWMGCFYAVLGATMMAVTTNNEFSGRETGFSAIALILAGSVTAAIVVFGWAIFLNGSRKSAEENARPFPVHPMIDAGMGLVCFVVLLFGFRSFENWRGDHHWQRVKGELEAKGENLDYKSQVRGDVPEEENVMAHPFMRSHFLKEKRQLPISAALGPMTIRDLKKLPRQPADVEGTNLNNATESLAGIVKWYEQFAPELGKIREALGRPKARVPGNPKELMAMPIPHRVSFRLAAHALEQLGKTHLLLNEPEAGWENLRTLHRLAEVADFNEPPPLTAFMIRAEIAGSFAKTMEETVMERLWPAAFWPRLQELCGRGDLVAEFSRTMRFGERVGILTWAEAERMEFFFGGEASLLGSILPMGWVQNERANYARAFQLILEGLPARGGGLDPAAMERGYARLEEVKKGLGWQSTMVQIALPMAHQACQKVAREQERLNQCVMALALERAREAKGSYPESLDELVPSFLAQKPADVFEGKPMVYRRNSASSYVLYSPGWNQKDDEGTITSDITTGDWVWGQ